MEDRRLVIEPRRYREETVVVSSRIPRDMLADVDWVAKETGRTRNEIMVMFLEHALRDTEIKKKT